MSIWVSNEPFAHAGEDLSRAIESAWSAMELQTRSSRGITSSRQALEATAVRQVIALTRIAKAFALDSGNHALFEAVRHGTAFLRNQPQSLRIAHMRAMLQAIGPFAGQLSRYGMEPGAFRAASDSLDALLDFEGAVRTSISGRKAVTQSMDPIMEAGTRALARLDNLVHVFDGASPEFVSGYRTARAIVHTSVMRRNDDDAAAA